jgi:hypothetical protein
MVSLKSSSSWSRSWLRKVLSGSWFSTCSPVLRNGQILFSKYILNYTSGYFLVRKYQHGSTVTSFEFSPPAARPCRQVGRRDHGVRGAISLSPSTSTSTCFTTSCFANFSFFPRSIFLFAPTLSFRVLILWFGAARPTHSITNTMSVHSDNSRYFMVKACQENTKYFSKFWSHLLDERAGLVEYRILNFSLTNADILLKTKRPQHQSPS